MSRFSILIVISDSQYNDPIYTPHDWPFVILKVSPQCNSKRARPWYHIVSSSIGKPNNVSMILCDNDMNMYIIVNYKRSVHCNGLDRERI